MMHCIPACNLYVLKRNYIFSIFIDDESDSSGVSVHVTKNEPKYLANIYLFARGFVLPPHTKGLY